MNTKRKLFGTTIIGVSLALLPTVAMAAPVASTTPEVSATHSHFKVSPMATYSSSFNLSGFAELDINNVDPNGTSGDFSWGGTYSGCSEYTVELVDSFGDVVYQWTYSAGTIMASSNEHTVAAGNYTCVIKPVGSSTMSANGTVFWD